MWDQLQMGENWPWPCTQKTILVHVLGQVVRPGPDVRRDERGDGGGVGVGEVDDGHPPLVHHRLQILGAHKGLQMR